MTHGKSYRKALAFVLALTLLATGFGLPKASAADGEISEPPRTETQEEKTKVTVKAEGYTLTLEVKDGKVNVTAVLENPDKEAGKLWLINSGKQDGDKKYPALERESGKNIFKGSFDLSTIKGFFPGTEENQEILLQLDKGEKKLLAGGKMTKEDAKALNEAITKADQAAAKAIVKELKATIEADKEKAEYKDGKKYTQESWKAFTDAQKISDSAELELVKAKLAKANYELAKSRLVKVGDLPQAIEKFEKVQKEKLKDKYYTESSLKDFKAQEEKLDSYKQLLINGDEKAIESAVKALNDAKLVLVDPNSIDFISRVAGKDRIATAIEISKKYYKQEKSDEVGAVILARSDDFPDALAAASLAKAYKGPILLTPSDHLDKEVYKEIQRLDPYRVILVGGKGALSDQIKADLKGITLFGIDRVAGEDRFETSAAVARKVADKTGQSISSAVIATGENWPDALTASTLALKTDSPILLVRTGSVSNSVTKAIKDLGIKETYIVGGTDAISKSVEEKLPKLIKRLKGETRYETAKAVAEFTFGKSDHVFLASGEAFADALAIGPVAGREKSPIILTQFNQLPKPSKEVLENGVVDHFTIIGGDGRIAIFKLEAEEDLRDANIKQGKPIKDRYKGKVPTLKEALNR